MEMCQDSILYVYYMSLLNLYTIHNFKQLTVCYITVTIVLLINKENDNEKIQY